LEGLRGALAVDTPSCEQLRHLFDPPQVITRSYGVFQGCTGVRVVLSVLCLCYLIFSTCPNPATAEDRAAFAPGEKLVFRLRWAFIPAGTASLQVLSNEIVNGEDAYHFRLTAQSNAFVDNFYKVRDRIDAFTDNPLTHSVYFRKNQHEGSTQREVEVNFDWVKQEAVYANHGKKIKPIELLAGAFDPLSVFYFARSQGFKPGMVVERAVTDGKKCVVGRARVVKRQTIKVPAGTFDTLLLEPELKHVGGVFEKSKDARIRLWVTADHRHIPVKISSKVVVGSFVGELVSFQGVGVAD
jgi:hypothetical protein